MRGQIGSAGSASRVLLVGAALLALLLVPRASAAAKPAPELTLSVQTVGAPGMALSPSITYARAIQAPAAPGEAREAISISSATPSVCTIIGYVWGPGEAMPAEREMEAETWVYGDGTCTLVASVQATSSTEAAEVSKSFTAGGPPIPGAPTQPTISEITFDPPGQTYLGGTLGVEAKSARPGLTVASSTPAICAVSPSQTDRLGVVVDPITTGTCSLVASLPNSPQGEAVAVTKSILIATVSFTSTPPSHALAGGSYEVTVSSAPGLRASLRLEGGACTFTRPVPERSLEAAPHSEPGPIPPEAPATVYFLRAGTCTISAGGNGASERVSQSFTVAPGPPEQIAFTSAPPRDAVVGQSYSPTVRSSLGWPVLFSSATPSVCKIVLGSSASLTETINGVRLAPSSVQFIAAGTCTIDVKASEGSAAEQLEAHQSFTVGEASQSPPPSSTSASPASPPLSLIGGPSVDHESASVKLKASCSERGTLSWRLTFKRARGGAVAGIGIFGAGALKIGRASSRTLTIRPTRAALRALRHADKNGHSLSVKVVLTFRPSSGDRPSSLERSILVR